MVDTQSNVSFCF